VTPLGPLPTTGSTLCRGRVNKTTRPGEPANPTPGRVKIDTDHPLRKAATDALKSTLDWDRFYALAQTWCADELLARLGNSSDVRWMLTTWPAGVSRSTGGLEAAIAQLKNGLGYRANVLANLQRTQQLLNLMLMAQRGLDDEQQYTKVIVSRLLENAGAGPALVQGYKGGPRLQGQPAQRNKNQTGRQATRPTYPRRTVKPRHTPTGRRQALSAASTSTSTS
jgi:hypothetical protein